MTGECFMISIIFLLLVLEIIPTGLALFILISTVLERFNNERKN